jgi:hypothetical protein
MYILRWLKSKIYHIIIEEITLILQKVFQKIEKGEHSLFLIRW